MGKIITCIGEENMGVTTTALMLAEQISKDTKKETLVIDLNVVKPDIYKLLTGSSDLPKYNLDIIMNYAVSEENLEITINTNVQKLTNSKLQVIMGTNVKKGFIDTQYINLLNAVEKMYDFIIIDSNLKVSQVVLDYSDSIIFVADESLKNLDNIVKEYRKILKNEKTEVLLNRYEGVVDKKQMEEILNKKISYILKYDKQVTKFLNENNLRLEEGIYAECINKVSKKVLKKYGVKIKQRWFLKNIFMKGKVRNA